MKKAFSLPGAVAAFFALTVFFPAGPAWAEEVRLTGGALSTNGGRRYIDGGSCYLS